MARDKEKYNAWMRAWNAKHRVYTPRREYLTHGDDGLTSEHLRSILSYTPSSGVFVWVLPGCMRMRPGDQAGSTNKKTGYAKIRIQGKEYASHRLAWLYTHGHWPIGDIDHINGIRNDNRISNLRDVTRSVNCQNQRSARSDNSCGHLGVSLNKKSGKYQARIWHKGKLLYLGSFVAAEEAHAKYVEAKRSLHEGSTL
jgi:hypothetical protein